MIMWQSTQRSGFHTKTENIKIHDELHAPNADLAALSKFRQHATLRKQNSAPVFNFFPPSAFSQQTTSQLRNLLTCQRQNFPADYLGNCGTVYVVRLALKRDGTR